MNKKVQGFVILFLFFNFMICALFFVASCNKKNSQQSHYGFEYLSSYSDCLKRINNKYKNANIVQGQDQVSNLIGEVPTIRFNAPFNKVDSINTLYFTPKTKLLYQISHIIGGEMSEANTSNLLSFAKNLLDLSVLLNSKYGKGHAESNFYQTTTTWKDKGINIILINKKSHLEHKLDKLILTYTDLTALKRGKSEVIELNSDI